MRARCHDPDALVGRQADLVYLRQQLGAGVRWITLTGAAGVGKTRLATEVALGMCDPDERDAIRVCRLATARGKADLERLVRESLGAQTIPETLGTLSGVILDACDGLTPEAVTCLENWQAQTPGTWFLVTSRVAVGASTEVVHPVEPLDDQTGLELLVARLRHGSAEREAAQSNNDRMLKLVASLGGLPLGIELAAGRIDALGVDEFLHHSTGSDSIGDEAHGRYPTLGGCLRAALHASWESLDDVEKEVLLLASVFVGNAPLDALEELSGVEAGLTLDAVQCLVRKSLLRVDTDPIDTRHTRYALPESVRAFAHEQLGGGLDERRWHVSAWYHSKADGWRGGRATRTGTNRLRLRAEYMNLYAIVQRFLQVQASESAEHAMSACSLLYRGSATETGAAGIARMLHDVANAPEARQVGGDWYAETLMLLAASHKLALRYRRSVEVAERAVQVAEHLGDLYLMSSALQVLGLCLSAQGQLVRARSVLERQLRCAKKLGFPRQIAAGRYYLAMNALPSSQEGLVEKRDELREVMDAFLSLQGPVWACLAGIASAEASQDVGDLELARTDLERVIDLAGSSELPFEGAHAELQLALVLQEGGQFVESSAALERAETLSSAMDFPDLRFQLAIHHALLELDRGSFADAARWLDGCHAELSESLVTHGPLYVQWKVARALAGPLHEMGGYVDDLDLAQCTPRDADVLRSLARQIQSLSAVGAVISSGRRAVLPDTGGCDVFWSRGRVLARALAARRASLARQLSCWSFDPQGRWFVTADGERVSLGRRHTLARLLSALLSARKERPGVALERPVLFEAGWPGQSVASRSLNNRLNVAVSSLRKSGLSILERHESGYRLDPAVPVTLDG